MKRLMLIELDIDEFWVSFRYEEELEWFLDYVLDGNGLFLHSNEIGNVVGEAKGIALSNSSGKLINFPWTQEEIEKEIRSAIEVSDDLNVKPSPSKNVSNTVDMARRRHFTWLTENNLSTNNEWLCWLGRAMFAVASQNELTAAQWDVLTKRYQGLGIPWLKAGQALWDVIHHEALQDLEEALLAYIPAQFHNRQCLWDMTLDELRRSARAVQRHVDNGVAAFQTQVRQWYQSGRVEDIPF